MGLDFPLGESSDNKRVLQGIISCWYGAVKEPADLFIPANREDAARQMQSMVSELKDILKRQSEHFSFQVVESGSDLPRVNNTFLISEEAVNALQNYIQELKKVHEL